MPSLPRVDLPFQTLPRFIMVPVGWRAEGGVQDSPITELGERDCPYLEPEEHNVFLLTSPSTVPGNIGAQSPPREPVRSGEELRRGARGGSAKRKHQGGGG